MLIAITRKVSPAIQHCELTHLQRTSIDFEKAERQHKDYERALAALGCGVRSLAAEPDLPDSVFVEDAAIVLDEVAVITRPGAESRRAETASVAQALRKYRPLVEITAPGTLDGGDVLRIGRNIYVGISGRSNEDAIRQLTSLLKPFEYSVCGVPLHGCLHLKSAITQITQDTVLMNPAWVSAEPFTTTTPGLKLLEIASGEDYAANAVLVGDSIIYPENFPRTAAALERAGVSLCRVDVSELQKAEGAVTCCSLLFSE